MKTEKQTILQRMSRLEKGYDRDPENNTIRKLREADVDAFNKAREATIALLDATNTMGAEDAVMLGIIRGITQTHRYLQGQGIPAMLKAIGEFGRLAESEHLFDARNAHVVKLAQMLRESELRERIYWED